VTAFNVVRFRVRPGQDQAFVDAHRAADTSAFEGFRNGWLVKTGERAYCMIGEWDDFSCIERSRAPMIAVLDSFRDTLEDLGNGLGVSDPVSGAVVMEMN